MGRTPCVRFRGGPSAHRYWPHLALPELEQTKSDFESDGGLTSMPSLTPKVMREVVRQAALVSGIDKLAPHDDPEVRFQPDIGGIDPP
jgi:hypothetical protein